MLIVYQCTVLTHLVVHAAVPRGEAFWTDYPLTLHHKDFTHNCPPDDPKSQRMGITVNSTNEGINFDVMRHGIAFCTVLGRAVWR